MMQATDGKESGATQREIASVLFGPQPEARSDWQNASARYVVRRLQQDMRAMIDGNYRNLLRSRQHTRKEQA